MKNMKIVYDTRRRKVSDKLIESTEKKVFKWMLLQYELQIKLFPMLQYGQCLQRGEG